MIVWVKARATGYPNEQRFEIIGMEKIGQMLFFRIDSCGTPGDKFTISPGDVCGVEIKDGFKQITMKFDVTKWTVTEQQPVKVKTPAERLGELHKARAETLQRINLAVSELDIKMYENSLMKLDAQIQILGEFA